MPQEEQNEWPSFEAVLRDVAPSDVARRTQTAIATSRRALATVDAARDQRQDSSLSSRVLPQQASDVRSTESPEPHAEAIDQPVVTEDRFLPDLLPEPLPPLELDTSAVRALLEPRGASIDELEFELEALAPLDIVEPEPDQFELDLPQVADPEANELELDEPRVADAAPDELPEVGSVFDLAFGDGTVNHEITQEIELPTLADTPVELFDDLGFENELAFDAGPFDEGPFETVAFEDVAGGAVFEIVETSSTVPDSDASNDDKDAEDVHEELHEDVTAMGTFDSVATADEIEGDLTELFTFDTDFAEPVIEDEEVSDQADRPDVFDVEVVETVDIDAGHVESDPVESAAIESDPFDNVVPIRAEAVGSAGDESYWATEGPGELYEPIETRPVVDAEHTGWVGLDNDPEVSDEPNDPWAYMRPSEEGSTKSRWARRPKFFGGDERKRRKAERRETATHAAEAEDRVDAPLDVAFDSECPNCGSECQVDLDDPIGRRVHVSCPSCDHMWFTPYIIDSKAG